MSMLNEVASIAMTQSDSLISMFNYISSLSSPQDRLQKRTQLVPPPNQRKKDKFSLMVSPGIMENIHPSLVWLG